MLTTKQILDRVFNRIRDNSPELRVKMVGWLNTLMVDIVNEPRDWVFLHKKSTLPITSNDVTLPADFSRESFIKTGVYFFTVGDRLTASQAELIDQYGGDPAGYTILDGVLSIHPGATGTAELTYVARCPDAGYADGTDETIFPHEFLPFFERALLAAFYEYDVDVDRTSAGIQLSQEQMRKMKALDNQRKALPQLDPRGLVRGK